MARPRARAAAGWATATPASVAVAAGWAVRATVAVGCAPMYLKGLFRSLSFFMQPSITCAPEEEEEGSARVEAAAAVLARVALLEAL